MPLDFRTPGPPRGGTCAALTLLIFIFAVLPVLAQPATDPGAAPLIGDRKASSLGIVVEGPKLCDERALRALIRQTDTRLAGVNPFSQRSRTAGPLRPRSA